MIIVTLLPVLLVTARQQSCGKVMFSVVSVCSHLSASGRLAFDGNVFLLGYSVCHNAIVHLLEIPVHTVQHMYIRQCHNANFSI